jgi:hypothetical protein
MQLKEIVAKVLPQWLVSVDEAQMVNIGAECLDREEGVVYIEEFNTAMLGNTRFGVKLETKHEITFCVFSEFQKNAEEREQEREERIMPAVYAVQKELMKLQDGIVFTMDKFPRGFDANEILVHITFTTTDNICLG